MGHLEFGFSPQELADLPAGLIVALIVLLTRLKPQLYPILARWQRAAEGLGTGALWVLCAAIGIRGADEWYGRNSASPIRVISPQ